MKMLSISTITAICLLGMVEPAWAQGSLINLQSIQQQEEAKKKEKPEDPNTVPVTFVVPLNVSQLSPQISYVIVSCSVTLTLSGHQPPMGFDPISVVNGGVATTARVVVRLPKHSVVGETASYRCLLEGFSTALNGSSQFLANHAMPELRLSPTPAPLTGTFPWN